MTQHTPRVEHSRLVIWLAAIVAIAFSSPVLMSPFGLFTFLILFAFRVPADSWLINVLILAVCGGISACLLMIVPTIVWPGRYIHAARWAALSLAVGAVLGQVTMLLWEHLPIPYDEQFLSGLAWVLLCGALGTTYGVVIHAVMELHQHRTRVSSRA